MFVGISIKPSPAFVAVSLFQILFEMEWRRKKVQDLPPLATVAQVFSFDFIELTMSAKVRDNLHKKYGILKGKGLMIKDTVLDGQTLAERGVSCVAPGDKIYVEQLSQDKDHKWILLRGRIHQPVQRIPFLAVLSIPRNQPGPRNPDGLMFFHGITVKDDLFGYRCHFSKPQDFQEASTGDLVVGTMVPHLKKSEKRPQEYVTANLNIYRELWDVVYPPLNEVNIQTLRLRADAMRTALHHEEFLKERQTTEQLVHGELHWIQTAPPVLVAAFHRANSPLAKEEKALKMKAGVEVKLSITEPDSERKVYKCPGIVDEDNAQDQDAVLLIRITGGPAIHLLRYQFVDAPRKVTITGVYNKSNLARIDKSIQTWSDQLMKQGRG